MERQLLSRALPRGRWWKCVGAAGVPHPLQEARVIVSQSRCISGETTAGQQHCTPTCSPRSPPNIGARPPCNCSFQAAWRGLPALLLEVNEKQTHWWSPCGVANHRPLRSSRCCAPESFECWYTSSRWARPPPTRPHRHNTRTHTQTQISRLLTS